MKGLYRWAASAAIAWGLVVALACGARAMPSPILHWKLDHAGGDTTAVDSSGSNDGTVNGATWTAVGQIGGALQFDGIDDYVEDADGGGYISGLDAITVTMWIKSDSIGVDNGFLTCDFLLSQQDQFLSCRYDDHGGTGGGDDVIKIGVNSTGGAQQLESSAGIQTTDWQHIAFTWADGQQIQLYIDGAFDTPTDNYAATSGTISGPTTLILGGGPKFHWAGLIDDFRIYDVVLTATEVDDVFKGTPEVTITSADPDAVEELDAATFTVTREGNLSGNLTVLVHVDVSGTADYATAPAVSEPDGTVTILDGNASATVTVTPVADTTYEPVTTLTISVSPSPGYDVGAPDQVEIKITDDEVPPPGAFSLHSPADGAANVTDTPQLTWTAASGATSYTVTVYDNPSLTPPAVDSSDVDAPATSYVVTAGTLAWDAQYWWHVVAHKTGANDTDADPTEWCFWTSVGGPPTVTRTDPDHEEQGVDISAGIEVHFSEPMAAGTEGAISVADAGDGDVAGSATLSGLDMVLTFVPEDDLDYNATYTVTIDAAAATDKAVAANALDATNSPLPAGGDYAFTFTTFEDLTGLATGEGCVPAAGYGVAWLVLALAALAARRRRP